MATLGVLVVTFLASEHLLGARADEEERPLRELLSRRRRPTRLSTTTAPSNVAVCFVGQFIRSKEFNSDIHHLLGDASFDAFVASSTQHEELDENSRVDEAELCSGLTRRGFENCYADLVPYDSRVYATMTEGIEYQSANGVFPFRIASLFSTIARCIRYVKDTSGRHRRSYGAIVVTRLDVINGIQRVGPLNPWWARALQFDLVGSKKTPGLIDDRFFFGSFASMEGFAKLDMSFRKLWSSKANSPERMLYTFAVRELSLKHLGAALDFISFETFAVNDRKYSLQFKAAVLESAFGTAVPSAGSQQADCAHIRTPHARNACMDSLRSDPRN